MEFEKKGIPSTTVCTDEFVALGKAEAQASGLPYLAMITLPHPIGGIDLKEVVKKAHDAMEDMIKILTISREKLSERAND